MKSPAEILYRKWTADDFDAIRSILLETWLKTYTFIPEADLKAHLDKFYSLPELEAMYNSENVSGIIADCGAPCAFMKMVDDKTAGRFYVSSLYVLPEYQQLGIGRRLMKIAEQHAMKAEHDKIWLGVMKQNIKTLQWYKKNGFNFIEEEPFNLGSTTIMHLIGFKSIGH